MRIFRKFCLADYLVKPPHSSLKIAKPKMRTDCTCGDLKPGSRRKEACNTWNQKLNQGRAELKEFTEPFAPSGTQGLKGHSHEDFADFWSKLC